MSRSRCCRRQRGAASTELVLLTPVIIVLLLLLAFAGRLAGARSDVVAASRDAARAASIARSPAEAAHAARDAARIVLQDTGVRCAADDENVSVDVSDFRPGGSVSVTVRCAIPLRDLGLLGIPGDRVASATAVEVVDRFRSTE